VGVALGDFVVDVYELAQNNFLSEFDFDKEILKNRFLNDFIALGKSITSAVRLRIQALFFIENKELQNNEALKLACIDSMKEVQLLLPLQIGDYTDFYSSQEHAFNLGSMLRNPAEALLPNWKHLPVAYHGRASSIVVSGTPIKRPKGQSKSKDETVPSYGPTKLMDFELEMAFVIGKQSEIGETIAIENTEEFIFGFLSFNDWSARDIQAWEYMPLGPFLSKNFASTVSPWVVTLEALAPFRTESPKQDVEVLPYLKMNNAQTFDIELDVYLKTENGANDLLSKSNFKYLYWNIAQQLAHHTVNGCNVNIGDVMASGTISSPQKSGLGSMMEISWRGTQALTLSNGETRTFLENGDTVLIHAYCKKGEIRVGFGLNEGKIIC
jgi:fumarylacetoacetase